MGKLGVGVGDEFPVNEPVPPSPDAEDDAACEEWCRRRAEWRRRRDEWRAQRRAWRQDMWARRDAFKADLRRSLYEGFGPRIFVGPRAFVMHNGFVVRFLIALAFAALAIALLPFLVVFGFIALAIAFFSYAAGSGRQGGNRQGNSSP